MAEPEGGGAELGVVAPPMWWRWRSRQSVSSYDRAYHSRHTRGTSLKRDTGDSIENTCSFTSSGSREKGPGADSRQAAASVAIGLGLDSLIPRGTMDTTVLLSHGAVCSEVKPEASRSTEPPSLLRLRLVAGSWQEDLDVVVVDGHFDTLRFFLLASPRRWPASKARDDDRLVFVVATCRLMAVDFSSELGRACSEDSVNVGGGRQQETEQNGVLLPVL